MFSPEEVQQMVNEARAAVPAQPQNQGFAAGAPGFTIPQDIKDKLRNVMIGFLKLLFTEFMTAAPFQQQGLQRGPGPIETGPTPAPAAPVVPADISGPSEAVPVPAQPQPPTPPSPPVGAHYESPDAPPNPEAS